MPSDVTGHNMMHTALRRIPGLSGRSGLITAPRRVWAGRDLAGLVAHSRRPSHGGSHGGSHPPNRESGYLLFVRQWEPSYSDFHESSNGPHIATREDFSIHGLWPNYNDGTPADPGPFFCTQEKFKPSEISDLLHDLKVEWPTYEARGNNSFWKHEYEKHGTCSEETFADEHAYFAGVLALNKQYDLLGALKAANIFPSDSQTYPAADMEAAIDRMTGVPGSCVVNCMKGEVDEVDICMDKGNPPQPIACPNRPSMDCGDLILRPL